MQHSALFLATCPLWQLLSKLPIDARLGKLILLGVCFDATDEALTIAAALASRSPFLSPIEKRDEANESKRKFAVRPPPPLRPDRGFGRSQTYVPRTTPVP